MIKNNGGNGEMHLGTVSVMIGSGRGHSPEELAKLATDKIISVGGETHPTIRDQALAFREAIYGTVLFYMKQMESSSRTQICGELRANDLGEIADVIEKLGRPIWQ